MCGDSRHQRSGSYRFAESAAWVRLYFVANVHRAELSRRRDECRYRAFPAGYPDAVGGHEELQATAPRHAAAGHDAEVAGYRKSEGKRKAQADARRLRAAVQDRHD